MKGFPLQEREASEVAHDYLLRESAMIEWQTLPRSIRYTANGMTADVWPVMTTKRVFQFTVIDGNGVYVDCGMATTQDAACERALEAMKI